MNVNKEKYKCDIYDLPLSVFIEIYTNEDNDIEFENEEKHTACMRLIAEYMEIVGGKQLVGEIMRSNERITLSMMTECMAACENMLKLGMYNEVCDILLCLGYSYGKNDINGMKSRISALQARSQYDLDKLEKEEDEMRENIIDKPTKRSFINEVVAVGRFNRMHINLKEWTAGAYACLVKQTCAEIDELNRKQK